MNPDYLKRLKSINYFPFSQIKIEISSYNKIGSDSIYNN